MTAAALPIDESLEFFECRSFELDFFETAPCRFRNSVQLACTPEQLFEVFADPTSWPRWAPGIGSVEWTSPKPYGPGTTRTVRFWGGMAVYEDFFVYDAPREMAFRFYGTSQRVWEAFGERYQVRPTDGGCELVWTVAYESSGPIGGRVARAVMRANFRLYLWLLRRYVRKRY